MKSEDFLCPYTFELHPFYTKEALCAYAYGATPADFEGTPKMVTEDVDCADFPDDNDSHNHNEPHTHSVWGVVASQDFGDRV